MPLVKAHACAAPTLTSYVEPGLTKFGSTATGTVDVVLELLPSQPPVPQQNAAPLAIAQVESDPELMDESVFPTNTPVAITAVGCGLE